MEHEPTWYGKPQASLIGALSTCGSVRTRSVDPWVHGNLKMRPSAQAACGLDCGAVKFSSSSGGCVSGEMGTISAPKLVKYCSKDGRYGQDTNHLRIRSTRILATAPFEKNSRNSITVRCDMTYRLPEGQKGVESRVKTGFRGTPMSGM